MKTGPSLDSCEMSAQIKLSDKNKYFSKIYEKCQATNDVKGMYRQSKEQLGWRGGGPPQSLQVNGVNVTAPVEIANSQSDYFSSKLDKLMNNLDRTRIDPLYLLNNTLDRWGNFKDSRPVFSLREVTPLETLGFIKKT